MKVQNTVAAPSSGSHKNSAIPEKPAPIKATLGQRIQTAFADVLNLAKYPVYTGFSHQASKAKETAKLLTDIGGEHHKLKSSDGGKVSMTYVSTANFTAKVKAAGGKSATLTSESHPNLLVKALCFDENQAKTFLAALRGTAFFDAGWRQIKDGNKILLVTDEDYQGLIEKKLVNAKTALTTPDLKKEISPLEVAHTTPKTVILCPGIKGRKESIGNIQDMAAYLIHGGVNVVLFDYRGTGDSSGYICSKGIMMDLESIYRYLHGTVSGISEKDIAVVGNCFGAGPATQFAAKHGVHLILNHPFANIKDFACQRIMNNQDAGVLGLVPKRVQKGWFDQFGPKYNIPNELKDVKGHIAIVVNKTDEEVDASHDERNFEALPTNHPGQIIKPIFVSGIEHGAGWHTKPVDSLGGRRLQAKAPVMQEHQVDIDGFEWTYVSELHEQHSPSIGKEQMVAFLRQTGMTQDDLIGSL